MVILTCKQCHCSDIIIKNGDLYCRNCKTSLKLYHVDFVQIVEESCIGKNDHDVHRRFFDD